MTVVTVVVIMMVVMVVVIADNLVVFLKKDHTKPDLSGLVF